MLTGRETDRIYQYGDSFPEWWKSSHDARDICRDPECQEAVKVKPSTGRWYVTMAHPGFNSVANNRGGYRSEKAARRAVRYYATPEDQRRQMRDFARGRWEED